MADYVFIQRSRFGRSIFTLRAEELEITSYLLGQKTEVRVPLRSISSDYVREARRLPWLFRVPLVIALASFLFAYLARFRWGWPEMVAMYPASAFGIGCLAFALQHARRVELFVFRDHWERHLFSVIREREQGGECDAFVRELLDRLESVETGRRLTDTADSSHDTSGAPAAANRSMLSIAAGAFSALVPPITEPFLPSPFTLALVIAASTGGFIWAFHAFAAKEPNRYWSLAGVGLSIVPIVFYRY